jgi:hypothetical protein
MAVCAIVALYLNLFVVTVQAFMKVPRLKAMAPTQSEPPFAVIAAKKVRNEPFSAGRTLVKKAAALQSVR